MGFFNKILEKLGMGKEASAAPAPSSASSPGTSSPPQPGATGAAPQSATGQAAPAQGAAASPGQTAPAGIPQSGSGQATSGQTSSSQATSAQAPQVQPMQTVDVVAQLEQRAAQNPQQLNWKTSIVDLLKLLDMDSSLSARKELATELGCPSELMADSAQMNMWLHKTVLARIAANGGNVPQELLD